MKKFVLGLIVSACLTSNTLAATNCDMYQTQSDMSQCAVKAMQAADTRLLKFYKDYMKKLSAAEKKQLKASQRAWVKQKEKYCRTHTQSAPDGSMYGMEVAMCLEDKADERIETLYDMMKK